MSKPDFTLYRLIVTEAPVGIIFANRGLLNYGTRRLKPFLAITPRKQ